MRKQISILLLATLAFLAGYGYGRWYAKPPVAEAKSGAGPLYYRCPMHPSYTSDKPGIAPCCNMALVPVYADTSANAIHITPGQEQLIGVQYGVAEYAAVSRVVRGPGTVTLDEKRVARVQTKLEGYIDKLYVTSAGESVAGGQLLCSIYNRRAYVMAQMQFLRAQMEATGMRRPKQADPQVFTQTTQQDLRLARQQLEMLGFTEDQVDAVSHANQVLHSLPVRAPISGVVLQLNARLNQTPGVDPLLVIADLSTVCVTANVPVNEAAAVRPKQPAAFAMAHSQQIFHGSVRAILPEVDPATRSIKVLLEFPNPAHVLKPEMLGEIELHFGSRKRLTVPHEAVLDKGRTQAVFVDLGDGYLEPREVKTGERYGNQVEILRGLNPGQRIVTSGNFLLDSETQLRMRSLN